MNASKSKTKDLNIPHCSITGVTVRPAKMHINFVGSFGHLDTVDLYFCQQVQSCKSHYSALRIAQKAE